MKAFIKTISILSLIVGLSNALNAQQLVGKRSQSSSIVLNNIGFRAGANWSIMTEYPLVQNLVPSFQFLPTPNAAIFTEIPLNEQLSIQPEIAYAQKGFMIDEYTTTAGLFEGLNIPIGGRISLKTNYLEMPILAKINLGNAEQSHAYLLAGPAVGYLMSSKAVVDVLGILPIRVNTGTGIYNPIEFSGIAGAGLSVPMGASSFFVEGRYQYGFSRVLDTGLVLLPIRNRSFGVSFGLQIPLGK